VTRFHLAPGDVQGSRVTFGATAAHHLGRVLRAAVGDLVQAVDPHGELLSVRLTAIAPRRAEGLVVDRTRLETESPLRLTLAQAVPKGDRMEGIVRMTTELGVSRVIPLLTERGVVRLEPDRWQRVAREAAQQSGRARAPEITSPRALSDWRPDPERDGLVVCFWEEEPRGLMGRLPAGPCSAATVIVGPEGGLTAGEVGSLAEAGALVAGLGPRVLRTETAGAVAVALLQAHYGDLGRA
jgi:16S rRNA (uracil1498-N3)-methyltransferase